MVRIYQVEYLSRPDEIEHIEQFDCFRQACIVAKEMSDKHDGSSVIIAMDNHPEGGLHATGHIEFCFGTLCDKTGTLANVDVAR